MSTYSTLVHELAVRFGVTDERARRVIRRASAGSALPGQAFVDLAIDPHGADYYFIQELGHGAYGTVYSASSDGTRTPAFTVKKFVVNQARALTREQRETLGDDDSDESGSLELLFGVDYVEREWHMSRIIERRLTDRFCQDDAICAVARFYRNDQVFGYIVFPYVESVNLAEYIVRYIKRPKHEYNMSLRALGLQRQTTPELLLVAADPDDERAPEVIEALRELFALRQRLYPLADQLLTALTKLHRVGVIHKDIKPSNMLVELGAEHRLRLIDFGAACAFNYNDEIFMERERELFGCAGPYETTKWFEDPLAHTYNPTTSIERRAFYEKFEVYAAAKTILCMMDPDIFYDNAAMKHYPVVRGTTLMVEQVFNLLTIMTGEDDDPQPPSVLPPADLARRKHNLGIRPFMAAAHVLFLDCMDQLRGDIRELDEIVRVRDERSMRSFAPAKTIASRHWGRPRRDSESSSSSSSSSSDDDQHRTSSRQGGLVGGLVVGGLVGLGAGALIGSSVERRRQQSPPVSKGSAKTVTSKHWGRPRRDSESSSSSSSSSGSEEDKPRLPSKQGGLFAGLAVGGLVGLGAGVVVGESVASRK